MDVAELSTAMHQSQLQNQVGMRVQSMAQDHAERQGDGLAALMEGSTVQTSDASHLGNMVDTQA